MSDFANWKLDFSSRAVVTRKSSLPDPPGYDAAVFAEMEAEPAKNKNKELDTAVLARKELALRAKALEPLKQVGFMCFMLWMSGNSLQLFSIMMLSSCIYSPFQAIANVTKAFPKNKDVDVLIPRALYCAVHVGQLIFAAYKLDKMGLLPTHASDWSSQLKPPVYLERAYGPSRLQI
jgi:ER membrane protein complex subunit 4